MTKNGVKTLGQLLTLSTIAGFTLLQDNIANANSHTIQAGDSFYAIGQAYNIDPYELAAHNNMTIYSLLLPGQSLSLPTAVVSESSAQAASETAEDTSYQLEGYAYEEGVTYPIGQCTWAVKKLAAWAGDWWGNGSNWSSNAASDGYAVGTTPAVGSIICWNDGSYGHVGYVIAVESETNIQILEANYGGKQWIDNYRGWFNPLDSLTPGQVTYIYPSL